VVTAKKARAMPATAVMQRILTASDPWQALDIRRGDEAALKQAYGFIVSAAAKCTQTRMPIVVSRQLGRSSGCKDFTKSCCSIRANVNSSHTESDHGRRSHTMRGKQQPESGEQVTIDAQLEQRSEGRRPRPAKEHRLRRPDGP
jgi:hypothetical protein